MPRAAKAVINYPPEYLELFRRASREPVTIRLTGQDSASRSAPEDVRAQATRFRADLYSLRAAMRRESHHMQKAAEMVEISIEYYNNYALMIARPAGSRFVQALRDSGISSSTPKATPEVPGSDAAVTDDDFEAALAKLTKNT